MNGRITRNTAFSDGLDFARQIGMLPPQGSGVEKALYGAFNGMNRLKTTLEESKFGDQVSVLVAFTVGMVWFIVAWSLGVKAFDAFLVTMLPLITLIAATARIMAPAVMKIIRPQ